MPAQQRSAVTVAVVTYNSERDVEGFVASLAQAARDIHTDLFVADNASKDRTVALLREAAPDATILELNENRGYAAGINAVMAAAGTDHPMLVVNPDVRFEPGALDVLVGALSADAKIGMAAPRLVGADGSLTFSLMREPTVLRELGTGLLSARVAGHASLLGETITDAGDYQRAGDHDWASGAALLLAPAAMKAVGAWDESYFLYSEETDYASRVRAAGYSVRFVPDATMVHFEGDSGVSPALWALLVTSKLRYFSRRHGAVATFLYRCALLIRSALRMNKATHRAAVRRLLCYRPLDRPLIL